MVAEQLDSRQQTADSSQNNKRGIVCFYCCLLSVVCCLSAVSVAWAHSEEAAVSTKTYSPITVDGKLDDWVRRLETSDWTGRLAVQKGQVFTSIRAVPIHVNALNSRVEAGTVSGPDDFNATLYTLWDDARFYIAAVVDDNDVVTQHEGADTWQDDCVELWFDCRHDAVTNTLFQDDEYQLGFSPASKYRSHPVAWAWRNPKPEPVIAGMQIASVLQPKGYVIEASIPWAAMSGCKPVIGGMMGFNISAVDKDEDQLWTHITWSGKLHSDPTQFGHLYFMDAPIDLFASDVFERTSDDPLWGEHE